MVPNVILLAVLWVSVSVAWSQPPLMSPAINIGSGTAPDVAYNPVSNTYMVVWKASGGQGLRGRIVRAGDTFGAEFSITGAFVSDGMPKVTCDTSRGRYLVVWKRGSDLNRMYGRFIPWAGPSPLLTEFVIDPIEEAAGEYAVTYSKTGDEYLVVWTTQYTTPSMYYPTVGRWIPADGSAPPGPSIPIANSPSNSRSWSGVAFNSVHNEYLVTTHDYPKVNDDIYGVLVTGNGVVKPEFKIAAWPDDESHPAVATCPAMDQYMVVWQSIRTSLSVPPYYTGLYARYINGDGTPSAMIKEIDLLTNYHVSSEFLPADVACGATDLLWEDPSYLVVYTDEFYSAGIWGRKLFPNGSMEDRFLISYGYRPAVAGGAINHLATYSNSIDDIEARFIGNTRPIACFTITPNTGSTDTAFLFDATCSEDNTHSDSTLQVRWDWDNDGIYDTPWSTTKTISHKFTLPHGQSQATFYVKVEVTDGAGGLDTKMRTLTVLRHKGSFYIIKGKNNKTAIINLD